ncbi:MAG: endolytic transglycosylase MltG [Actinobacteria bacterium]|nr:endolytic transglycosylase MltG [Actinomycetota bacterium]
MKKALMIVAIIGIFIILAVVLVFTGCQKITQADVGMQGTRWLVLLYKMTEDGSDAQAYELISQVEETLNQEFGNGEKTYVELANTGSAKDKYRILVRQNQLMEEALVKLKGKEALREIEGKYSLEEITQTDVDSLAFKYQFSAFQKGAAEELIVINLTTTEVEFIAKLKEQGYIKSELAFNFVLKRKGWQGKIEPGGYNVSKGMNAWQLADTLVNHPYQKWTVIPEGLRATEIAEKLQEKLGWANTTKAEFLSSSKEGYLFPDTYLLNLDYTGKDTAKRMENQFNEKTAGLFKEATENNILNDTLIVLASIVQREAASEKEMPLIAGIIWNRWLIDMKFDIDATIQYALGEPGNWWPIIKVEDYKFDSPYNTYLYKGRPPAPICNPGLAAIDAVINSEESEYFFYLHDSQGQIHLAKTYEEHKANIEKYLK